MWELKVQRKGRGLRGKGKGGEASGRNRAGIHWGREVGTEGP